MQQDERKHTPSYPLDLHYLAVLLQRRGRPAKARDCYENALKAYEDVGKSHEKLLALKALCWVDYGILLQSSLFEFEAAVDYFRKARDAVKETNAPQDLFDAYILCREAAAYRRLGRFVLSDRRMYEARALMAKLDPAELQPQSSAMWKQDAVAFMEQCKFKEASLSFKRSQRILENLLAKGGDRYLCLIELFHIKHGLALIERFQGQDEESLKQFRKLTPEIGEAFRDLDSQESMSNFTEVRHLLCERYVNSLERQADCSLFGQTPDYAEAADDYRRACGPVVTCPRTNETSSTSISSTAARPRSASCHPASKTLSWPKTCAGRPTGSNGACGTNRISTSFPPRSGSPRRSHGLWHGLAMDASSDHG